MTKQPSLQNESPDAAFGAHPYMSNLSFPSGPLLQWNDWSMAQVLRPPVQETTGERGQQPEVALVECSLPSQKQVSAEAGVWPKEEQTVAQLFNSWRKTPLKSDFQSNL